MSMMVDKIEYKIQNKLFHKYTQLSFSYYDKNDTGSIISIIENDVPKMDHLLWRLPTIIFSGLADIVGALIVFSSMNKTLLLLVIPSLVGMILTFWIIPKKISIPAFRNVRRAQEDQMVYVKDIVSGMRTTISFNKQKIERKKFKSITDDLGEICKGKWFAIFLNNISVEFFMDLYWGTIIVIGGIFLINGKVTVSELIAFLMYDYIITDPICKLTDLMQDVSPALTSFERILQILDEPVEIKNSENAMKPEVKGDIEFNNVSFTYANDSDNVLTDINLHIKEGEYVAIVGTSGAGKSTIAGLIPRFYDTTKGSICIDGINVRDIDLGHLRSNIGVVQQEPYLFHGTVFENISYGNSNASMEEVIEAAKRANAHEFISKLPKGYNSDIGEHGVKLSGGQKQRIAIARLFLTNPPILIFDEATSALDNISQRSIQRTLDELASNKTTIVIAHRLSTIKNADRIVLLTENGIEEQGTHSELLKKNGKYAKLYDTELDEEEQRETDRKELHVV